MKLLSYIKDYIINDCNKTCKSCEFCSIDDNNKHICISGESEVYYGNRIYDFKKTRSCWHVGYNEYRKIKKLVRKNNG